jgi:hypothetical protein
VAVVVLARRLTGLVLALVLVTGLPVAAVRAGCVCDHGHTHDRAAATAQKPHICTAACTAATCPMHRNGRSTAAHDPHPAGRTGDAMRCGCAGEAQALIGQASVTGVLPALVSVHAPMLGRASLPSVAEALLSLAATPPAPPPRA